MQKWTFNNEQLALGHLIKLFISEQKNILVSLVSDKVTLSVFLELK